MKLIGSSNLFAASAVEDWGYHSLQVPVLPRQLHLQRSVFAMEQNRIVKLRTLLTFDWRETMMRYQQFVSIV